MHLQLGDVAPDFTADTTKGKINYHDYLKDSWGLLFSHPADFTPVCTTELGRTSQLMSAFKQRNVKVMALSVDPVNQHFSWINDINETQNTEVDFPLIADENREIAELYGMIHPKADNTMTVRSVFVIGPDKKIKLMLTYPAATGRNFDEILRVIDSLQLTAYQSVATPADWKSGEDCVILPSVSDEQAKEKFPKGFKTVKPYLRLTPDPSV